MESAEGTNNFIGTVYTLGRLLCVLHNTSIFVLISEDYGRKHFA